MKPPKPWNTKSESKSQSASNLTQAVSSSDIKAPLYWKTWLAIVVIALATVTGLYVIWSLLFIYWIFISIKNKELFFVEKVGMHDAPITFWTTMLCWFFVSIYVLWEFVRYIA